jgi:protein TonB
MSTIRYFVSACALAVLTTTITAQDHPKTSRSDDPGVVAPVATKAVHPAYTREALEARIQGTVGLDAVVLDDGTVGDVTVTKPLDDGLDQQAVKAMKQWQFKPGTKDRKPVPVLVSVTMSFSLK